MALMDNIPGWKVFSAGIGIAALIVVGYFAYQWFLAPVDDLVPLERQAVEHALEQLAKEYEADARFYGRRNVVVMPVYGDTTNNQIREMTLRRLDSIDGVRATEPGGSLDRSATELIRKLIRGEPDQEKHDLEALRDEAEAVFADAGEANEVLALHKADIWSTADSGGVDLDAYRISRRRQEGERIAEVLEPRPIKGLSGRSLPAEERAPTGPGFWAGVWAFLWRALVVLFATAIFPLLSWPLAKAAFRQDKNALNAALLIGLTVLDLVVLFALVEFQFSTAAVISAGVLLPVALIYNFRMLNLIEEQ